MRSSATPSGSPSNVNVWTITSFGRTSWKLPWKPNSSCAPDMQVAV